MRCKPGKNRIALRLLLLLSPRCQVRDGLKELLANGLDELSESLALVVDRVARPKDGVTGGFEVSQASADELQCGGQVLYQIGRAHV